MRHQLAMIAGALGIDGVALGLLRILRLVLIGWGGDRFDPLDDRRQLAGKFPQAGEGLVFPAGRQVFEYRGLDGVEVAVGDGDGGIGYFAEVGDGQHAGVGEVLQPWHAGKHDADVAVEQGGPFAAADFHGQLRRMGVDVVGIVGGRHGGHGHRGDVHAAGVVDEGIIRLFGDPLLARRRRLR